MKFWAYWRGAYLLGEVHISAGLAIIDDGSKHADLLVWCEKEQRGWYTGIAICFEGYCNDFGIVSIIPDFEQTMLIFKVDDSLIDCHRGCVENWCFCFLYHESERSTLGQEMAVQCYCYGRVPLKSWLHGEESVSLAVHHGEEKEQEEGVHSV